MENMGIMDYMAQFPYDPKLVKLYSQDKLEYCLACNTSSNKLKFTILVTLLRINWLRSCRDINSL
ncbi:hypothetical protein RhiirA1_478280 [Rhizophagus irregularis]|uniref:Uncharacterized protein n=1 Tax=Rhizophagus irregularis TaxID=588596 RepID=A0A2N0QS95_9GLOM|nr:hypothetical protein RhiirA1_478280 [Rhizophagus irregularis]